ncbi:ferredoxin [Mycolicibacterium phocaicum]|uniref:Ferredoxin n=1 Tax=Mycolicibacterium phocaicum TaxID=319706 RepID=A0A7I7ZV27_9MYCO|nr:ferredoxin [Mycolicibacterium phocaicum]TLH64039.1 ferredoxin [Mycolicibacterium phocaicum]BBZ58098.1 ferredoxin [Mycolicibacterium phocaicum]
MKIALHAGKCDGIGMCEAAAPDIFEVGDDGLVHVLDPTPDEDRRHDVQEAIDSCPVRALLLED